MNLEYDAISPITGNECVVIEADEKTGIESRMCMESGYTTSDTFKIDSEDVKQYETGITKFMCDKKYIDEELQQIWYPIFMRLPGGMLYCEQDSNSILKDLQWKVAKVVDIIAEERLKYPIPGKSDEYYTSRLDVENAITYTKYDFSSALNDLYSVIKEVQHED
jgi:hypothetical protein